MEKIETSLGPSYKTREQTHTLHLSTLFKLSMTVFKKKQGSKKGKLSGEARKTVNKTRADKVASGKAEGEQVGRVVKHLGMGRIEVALDLDGRRETVQARIPKVFGRKGTTPITTSSIVSIFVGNEFDPKKDSLVGSKLEVTSILSDVQIQTMKDSGDLPLWMLVRDPTSGTAFVTAPDEEMFEFDYSVVEEKTEKAEKAVEKTVVVSRKTHVDFDIDDI